MKDSYVVIPPPPGTQEAFAKAVEMNAQIVQILARIVHSNEKILLAVSDPTVLIEHNQ